MQARLYACVAEACDDLRHATQAALLRACLLSARHMGLEAQMRRLCKKGAKMKTVIEMARDQGLPETEMAGVFIVNQDDLARFAALVIANHPPQSYMTWQEGYEAGKQAERERLQAFMRQMIDAYSLQSDPSGLKARSNT
jgi:hypothetical protein